MLSRYAAARGDFAEQWRQVKEMTETIYLPPACLDCAYRSVCPSCAAVTESNHGDPSALVEGMCRYTKTYCQTYVTLAAGDVDGVSTVKPDDTSTDPVSHASDTSADGDSFVCL
jgi:hypothetical protein